KARCTVTRPLPSASARRAASAVASPSTARSASRLASPRSRSRTGPPTAYTGTSPAAVRAACHTAASGSSGPPISSTSGTAGLCQGDRLDLAERAPGQPRDLHGGAGRRVGGKERAVDPVDRREVAQVGDEDRGLADAVEAGARGREHRA